MTEMLKPGETCSTCGHDSGRHTRIVGMIPRWGWYCFACCVCPCDSMTSPPDEQPTSTLCGSSPNKDNATLSQCELPTGHRGPHKSGVYGWTVIPEAGPSLAVPYEWAATPKLPKDASGS